jgi:adhesin transport system outer membrane protein
MMEEFPRIKSGNAGVGIRQKEVETIRSQQRPQFGLSLRGGEERFRRGASNFALAKMGVFSLEASQLLFDGGSTKYRIAEARANRLRGEIGLETTRQDLALELSQNFVDILKYRVLIGFAEESVRIHQTALYKTTEKFRAGAGPKADVELVTARLAMAHATLEARHRQLARAATVYQKFTGDFPGELIEPEFPEWALPISIDEVDLARNPLLQAARARMEANQARLRVAKSDFSPQFSLFLQGDSVDSARTLDRTEDASALVVMSYDIFGGGRRRAELQKTQLMLDQSGYDLEDTAAEIRARFLNAWNDFVIAEERLYQLQSYRDSMTSVVSAYQRQFELGQRALINVLDVENELYSAKSSVEEERFNRLQAAYQTLSAMGNILEVIQ